MEKKLEYTMDDVLGMKVLIPINIEHLARIVTADKLDAGDLLAYAKSFLQSSNAGNAKEVAGMLERYTIDEIRSSLILSLLHASIQSNSEKSPTFLCEFQLESITPIENYSFTKLDGD